MRNFSGWILIVCGICAGLGACVNDGPEETAVIPGLKGHFPGDLAGLGFIETLDSSQKALELMKAMAGNSYRYTVWSASWTGHSSKTTLAVESGAVVKRDYQASMLDHATLKPNPGESYSETGSSVGSHANGAPTRLLDGLYVQCREYLKADASTHEIVLTLDSNYVVSRCGSRFRGCQDDCGPQITVSELAWGP